MSRGRAAAAFVEDAVLFAATIVPLAYFFGAPPILLATLVHFVSVPCAGVAHSARLGRAQTFFLSLASVATTIVDLFVAAYCACRIVPTNLCCVALSSIGVTCFDDLADAPLALFLLPVSAFNAARGVGRVVVVWLDASPRARSGVSFAFVACVKAAHVALLWSHPRDAVVAHLLRLAVAYAGISAIFASIDWRDVSSDALAGCFFLDQVVLALQAHETLAGRTSSLVPLGLAVASLVVTSGLAIIVDDERRYDPWSTAYAVSFSAFHATLLYAWWSELDAARGAIAVAYLASPLARTYAFRADAFWTVVAVGGFFGVVDVAALVIVAIEIWTTTGHEGGGRWALWGAVGSASISSVVSFARVCRALIDANTAKKNVGERRAANNIFTERVKVDTIPIGEFVASLRKEASGDAGDAEKIVASVVGYAKRLATIDERCALLSDVFAKDAGGSAAWDEIRSATNSRETLGEMGLTRVTYESVNVARTTRSRSAALRMPIETEADAMAFAFSTCSDKKITLKRMLEHAQSRRSYAMASNAEKIERLWKIVDWLSCDEKN